MDINTGRADHIEDVLVRLHTGQWFGWSDSKNKVYANLIIHDDTKTKPTEKELTDALAKRQSEFDNLKYSRDRANVYPSIDDQLDMQYWDQVNGTTTWKDAIAKVKADHPKP
tara:strand:+ start:880 stop:1215 length:336 start_codon:yes stop_codon:yes gene_type:complete